MTSPNIIQLRGTIFLPTVIGYSQANVDKYRTVLEESVVAPLPATTIIPLIPLSIQLPQDSTLQENGPWQLIKGALRVVFSPNKVDIILDSVNTKGSTETEFCQTCSTIFNKILEKSSVASSRLAFAPTYAKDHDETFDAQRFWGVMLANSTYGGATIEDVNLTSNYRVNKIIHSENVVVNFRSVFSDAVRNIAPGVTIKGSVMINFDINTAVIPNKPTSFTQPDVDDFFANVHKWSDDFFSALIK